MLLQSQGVLELVGRLRWRHGFGILFDMHWLNAAVASFGVDARAVQPGSQP